jgi:D-lactate dehydrogenase (cytochrome)
MPPWINDLDLNMIDEFVARMISAIGKNGVIADENDMAPYLSEWRGVHKDRVRAVLVARPASTDEVVKVVRLCAEAGFAVVPQGGNTGLVQGALADGTGRSVVLSLSRMNAIRSIDPLNYSMVVEAGVILSTIQTAAEEAGCFFPLSLGAEGSCQIGGNISTNAGGTGVLRYGNTRALVLGLEVVLPDGSVWDGLRALKKDNTGYDLKQIFIGAEGTLGIVTAAVLKLFPKPKDVQTSFCALADLESALKLLARARQRTGDKVSAFELLPRQGLDIACAHLPGVVDPLPGGGDWYALIEISSSHQGDALKEELEGVLEEAAEAGEITDAVIANSLEQRAGLWRIREELPLAIRKTGESLHHDIAVATSQVPEMIRRVKAALEIAMPGIRPVPFGHVGDGNIHFSLIGPANDTSRALTARRDELTRIVFDNVVKLQGSFSAEHGIGGSKLAEMIRYKSPVELTLMRQLKSALDPRNIMNPGKVVPAVDRSE